MRRLAAAVLTLIWLVAPSRAGCPGGQVAEWPPYVVVRNDLPGAYTSGHGIVIRCEAVLTAAHCVRAPGRPQVQYRGAGYRVDASVVDERCDVAVLHVPGLHARHTPRLPGGPLAVADQSVWYAGRLLRAVPGFRYRACPHRTGGAFRLGVPSCHGDSGFVVLDPDGRAVGVVSASDLTSYTIAAGPACIWDVWRQFSRRVPPPT